MGSEKLVKLSTSTWQWVFEKIVNSPCVPTLVVWLHYLKYWFRNNVLQNVLESMPLSDWFKLQEGGINQCCFKTVFKPLRSEKLWRLARNVSATISRSASCEFKLLKKRLKLYFKWSLLIIFVSLIVDPWMKLPESNITIHNRPSVKAHKFWALQWSFSKKIHQNG